jgi:hypothetical protein
LVPQQQVLLEQQPFLFEQGLELLLELAFVDLGQLADQRFQFGNVLSGIRQLPLDRLQLPLVPFGLIAHGMAGGPSSKGGYRSSLAALAEPPQAGPCPLRPPVPAVPSGRPPGDGERSA